MFGVPIQLAYSEKNATYNTKVGGCASVLVRIIMVLYMSLLVKRMVLNEADTITVVT